jgi:hypothetical protein
MWDLRKTLDAIAGMRRREAEGKPPYHETPEERVRGERFSRETRKGLKKLQAEFRGRGDKFY